MRQGDKWEGALPFPNWQMGRCLAPQHLLGTYCITMPCSRCPGDTET